MASNHQTRSAGAAAAGEQDAPTRRFGRISLRTKLVGNLVGGALMIGIVYNATLNQVGRTLPIMSADAVGDRHPHPRLALASNPVASTPELSAAAAAPVDPTPTGSIVPPRPILAKTKKRSKMAKAPTAPDRIAAFLQGTASSPSR